MAGSMLTPLSRPPIRLPLSLFEMVPIGELVSRDGEAFIMHIGADERVVEQLKKKSADHNDTEIQKNTSDLKRFSEGSYEDWFSKNRTPFTLIHTETGDLAAFVWFGPKPLGRPSLKYLSEEEQKKELEQKENVWHTVVYRSYEPFRGKGIMGDFVHFCMQVYKENFPDAKFWVGMSADNEVSAGLASRLGFMPRPDLFNAEKNWAAMTLE